MGGFVEDMYVCEDTTTHCSALHCITPHCNTKVGCSPQERKRLMWWHSMTACLCRECCGKTCASGCYIDLTPQSSQGSRSGCKYFCEIRQRSIRCGISKDVATVRVDAILCSSCTALPKSPATLNIEVRCVGVGVGSRFGDVGMGCVWLGWVRT